MTKPNPFDCSGLIAAALWDATHAHLTCNICGEVFTESVRFALHKKIRHSKDFRPKIEPVDPAPTPEPPPPTGVTMPPDSDTFAGRRALASPAVYQEKGRVLCGCPVFARLGACDHVAKTIIEKLDSIPWDFVGDVLIEVPIFVGDPAVVAHIALERESDRLEDEACQARLDTQAWANYPYGAVDLGVTFPGINRSALRERVLAWLVEQEDHQSLDIRNVLQCGSAYHGNKPHQPGERSDRERLHNLWYLLRSNVCMDCYRIEQAASV